MNEEEVVIPDPVTEPSEIKPEPTPIPEPEKPDYIEHAKERNLRMIREQNEAIARENAEMKRRLAQYENPMTFQNQTPQADDDIKVEDDAYLEGKHFNAMQQKIKKLEAKLQETEKFSSTSIAEARIRSEYPDYYSVVTPEKIKELAENYPSLAKTLSANPDLYSKAEATYTMIKKLGISEKDILNEEKTRQNMSKPKSTASISAQAESPLARASAFASGMSENRKKEVYREMMQIIKSR